MPQGDWVGGGHGQSGTSRWRAASGRRLRLRLRTKSPARAKGRERLPVLNVLLTNAFGAKGFGVSESGRPIFDHCGQPSDTKAEDESGDQPIAEAELPTGGLVDPTLCEPARRSQQPEVDTSHSQKQGYEQ